MVEHELQNRWKRSYLGKLELNRTPLSLQHSCVRLQRATNIGLSAVVDVTYARHRGLIPHTDRVITTTGKGDGYRLRAFAGV